MTQMLPYTMPFHIRSYDRHMPVYNLYKSIRQYMSVICRHILFTKLEGMTVICLRSLARDMAVYDRHMTVYDGKGGSFPSHSWCCDRYKTCHTGHFCFCTRYRTSCDWNMLAHPALPSFVPGGTRLARLNARLNVAHLLRPKGTLGQAQSNN